MCKKSCRLSWSASEWLQSRAAETARSFLAWSPDAVPLHRQTGVRPVWHHTTSWPETRRHRWLPCFSKTAIMMCSHLDRRYMGFGYSVSTMCGVQSSATASYSAFGSFLFLKATSGLPKRPPSCSELSDPAHLRVCMRWLSPAS